jgi:serine/threonine protein phosphatase PrpC
MGTPWDSPKYTISEETPITDGTCFLLCSDGFWELIDEKNMCKCLKASKTPDEWLDRMAAIVKKNGQGKNMDNFTATAVFCRKN